MGVCHSWNGRIHRGGMCASAKLGTMMPSFYSYITPEQAKALHDEANPKDKLPLSYWQKRARLRNKCAVCGGPVWKWGQTDMCFTCTTGEADPSDDYELVQL